jgi:hypothetical protein
MSVCSPNLPATSGVQTVFASSAVMRSTIDVGVSGSLGTRLSPVARRPKLSAWMRTTGTVVPSGCDRPMRG